VNHPNEVWLGNGEEMVVTIKMEHQSCCRLQTMLAAKCIHVVPNYMVYKPTWWYMIPCGHFEIDEFHCRMKLVVMMVVILEASSVY
jgi:hypothetical protein